MKLSISEIIGSLLALYIIASFSYVFGFFNEIDILLVSRLSFDDYISAGISSIPNTIINTSVGFLAGLFMRENYVSNYEKSKNNNKINDYFIYILIGGLLGFTIFTIPLHSGYVFVNIAILWILTGNKIITFICRKLNKSIRLMPWLAYIIIPYFILITIHDGASDAFYRKIAEKHWILRLQDGEDIKVVLVGSFSDFSIVKKDDKIVILPNKTISLIERDLEEQQKTLLDTIIIYANRVF